MQVSETTRFLFVINTASGTREINWPQEINRFFNQSIHVVAFCMISPPVQIQEIKDKITAFQPNRVVAVGGDGTVAMVAEALLYTGIALGILPAGSANGLARELGIPVQPASALQHLLLSHTHFIHTIEINGRLCVHLSDIGFNASAIKIFEAGQQRGMWGYVKASWKALLKHPIMQVTLRIDDNYVRRDAAMVVIANATRYGSGALINPIGHLDDHLFEVVIVRKISFTEIFKMIFTHRPFDKNKTELYQTQSLRIASRRKAHFQVDGEYLGKTRVVDAKLLRDSIHIIG